MHVLKEKQVKNKPTPPKSCSVNTVMPSITMSNHGIYQTSAFTPYILIVTACYSTILYNTFDHHYGVCL